MRGIDLNAEAPLRMIHPTECSIHITCGFNGVFSLAGYKDPPIGLLLYLLQLPHQSQDVGVSRRATVLRPLGVVEDDNFTGLHPLLWAEQVEVRGDNHAGEEKAKMGEERGVRSERGKEGRGNERG